MVQTYGLVHCRGGGRGCVSILLLITPGHARTNTNLPLNLPISSYAVNLITSTPRKPCEWDGNLVLPSQRAQQRLRADAGVQLVGLDSDRIDAICAQHVWLQESLGLRYLAGGIGFDETDYGILTVQPGSKGQLMGTVDLGPGLTESILGLSDVSKVDQALNAFALSTQLCMAQMNDARDFEYTWGDPHLMVQFTHWLTECESNLVALPAQLTVYAVEAEKRGVRTWWYKRDDQCVADAKTGFGKQVADVLEATGYAKEAEFCNVLREFFEALDLSGIPQDDREARVDRMIDWLADKAMIRFLESVPCNKTYAKTSSDPEKCTPLFNDRWRQSNDVENHFSAFKQILRKGMQLYSSAYRHNIVPLTLCNKASPTDAFLALKKLLIVHKVHVTIFGGRCKMTDPWHRFQHEMSVPGQLGYSRPIARGHSYEQKSYCNDITNLSEWSTGQTRTQAHKVTTLAGKRARADTTATPKYRNHCTLGNTKLYTDNDPT
ncbi:uncharacterized protein EV422DRAFT_503062 [Fimicolochytrium jonesii]|uniref:uncharacterized protein n=1 Tax=Fimicolochytrium jonesii TaxID=1396493 RepID=UPI0022FE1267|nr:uncharacterized protein EV422DRAFT_503062 [Fimicolochytrium jonesii]KAI8825676.1 hypothetical protein EV422DRAFT_503062 [Fimicolochytrium jonesii]